MPTEKRQRQKEGRAIRQAELAAARKRDARRRQAISLGVVLAIVVLIIVLLNRGKGGGTKATTTGSSTTAVTASTVPPTTATTQPRVKGDANTCPKADGSSPRATLFDHAPVNCIDAAKTYTATFATSEGQFTVLLDTKTTPQTTNNFVFLSRYHYYDNTRIFRTDTSIEILQGGSPTTESPSDPGPGYTIPDEGSPPRHYTEGDFVMARTQQPNSGGAQFFVVAGNKASALDQQGTYVTFGKVQSGIDVVKAILALNKDDPASGLGGAPSRPVTITSITIKES
jgi:cyclophilin family peptidyl-prolyl cis-trans isomerase